MEVLRGSAPLKKRIAERSRFILGSFYVLCFFTEALLRLQGAGVEQCMRKWLLGLLHRIPTSRSSENLPEEPREEGGAKSKNVPEEGPPPLEETTHQGVL